MSTGYFIPRKHTLKILFKSTRFPRKYKRKREWVFFSEHSVISRKQRWSKSPRVSSRPLYLPVFIIMFALWEYWLTGAYITCSSDNNDFWEAASVACLSLLLPPSPISISSVSQNHSSARDARFWSVIVHNNIDGHSKYHRDIGLPRYRAGGMKLKHSLKPQ